MTWWLKSYEPLPKQKVTHIPDEYAVSLGPDSI